MIADLLDRQTLFILTAMCRRYLLVLKLRNEFEPLVTSSAACCATVEKRRYPSKIADPFTEIRATVYVMNGRFESKRSSVACVRNPIANPLQRDLDLILPQGTAILIA